MAEKTFWKGVIHFSGVDVPVKLHSTVREERIRFHLLHGRDQVRLKQQLVCAYEHEPVPREEQAKGFELEEGKYLLLDQAELERAEPKSSRTIEVHEFVKTSTIDLFFFEKAYYLEPDSHIEEYNALAGAMREMDVAGICTWTMRKGSYYGALQAGGNVLRLTTLRNADEVIPVKSLEIEDIPLSEKELKIGGDLINQLSAPFQPQKFVNEHQEQLHAMIDKKARGERIAVLRPRRRKPTSPDKLLEALQASLKRAG